MPQLTPDPSFYPSPRMAMKAPAEKLAYVALINPDGDERPDELVVVDVDPASERYGEVIGGVKMPHAGDELHHFGWNACSSCLCPYAPHPHTERRYLVVPGIHSSRIHVIDTKPDPRNPKIVKVLEPGEVTARSGYMAPHTTHCGPDGIYMNALGGADGQGPGGIFVLDHDTFEIKGPWELDRGPQHLAYDFWWHLGHDTMVTSEWGTPDMVTSGLNPEILLSNGYGHRLHVWDLHKRRHRQTIDLGKEHQMVLELRPAHDPKKSYGFAGVVISTEDLSASIWVWHHDGKPNGNGNGAGWQARKVITIPAQPAHADDLPEMLKGFAAVPPLITDINLSVDDRFLYVSCWGTGELHQYDVSDPFHPKLTGKVQIGGIVNRTAHPGSPDRPRNGAPQMVEISRDGSRVYFTNSLYTPWDAQFYPEGIEGWMVKVDVDPDGGMAIDPEFFVDFGGMRSHQVRLEGGDASSDSYCFS